MAKITIANQVFNAVYRSGKNGITVKEIAAQIQRAETTVRKHIRWQHLAIIQGRAYTPSNAPKVRPVNERAHEIPFGSSYEGQQDDINWYRSDSYYEQFR